MKNFLLEVVDAKIAYFRGIHVERRTIKKRGGDTSVARYAGFRNGACAENIGRADGSHSGAVICIPARDDFACARFVALMNMIFAGKFKRVFVRFRARAAEGGCR